MNLSTRLAGDFSKNVRKRGEEYFYTGRVMIHEGSSSELSACVRGSGFYEVQLTWRDPTLSVWCDCPHFVEQGFPCKHLWAAIVAADQNAYLTTAASAEKFTLELETPALDDFDEGGDYGDDELNEEDRAVPLLPLRSPGWIRNSAKPKLPPWRKQLSQGFAARDPAEAAWPATQEILYVVDVAKNVHANDLVLSLQSRTRNAHGGFSRPKVLSMSQGQIDQLPPSEDREILSALCGGHAFIYGYADSRGYERVPESALLSPALASTLMPLVVRTGRCFLRPLNEPHSLLALAWDVCAPWTIVLEQRRHAESRLTLTRLFDPRQ